jgi:ATP-dependent Clp protease protease subunit
MNSLHNNKNNDNNKIRNSASYVEENGVVVDIYSKFLSKRVIYLQGEIDTEVSNMIKSQLLYLDSISNEDIKMYIDSGGGSVYTSLGIIDIMDTISCDVQTINIGLAASMAAVILSCGTKGKRKSLKRSRTMCHQPLGYTSGQSSDMEIDVKQIIELKTELYEILSERTGKSFDEITKDSDRDYWMKSKEALNYGIIDEIL